jgi:dTDP-glucose pyrophosphorylase/CBS domain-containing protein
MNRKLVLEESTTFEDAIRALDKLGVGFLPIVDADNRLLGIITDGDIRRAILNRRYNLDAIINRNPITLSCKVTRPQAINFLRSKNCRHLPLVDEENRLVDVITADDMEFKAKPNKVVIMAGGLGSRLGSLTEHTPKPMLHVGDKPLLSNIISDCHEHGLSHIYICVNYKAEVIKDYFEDGSRFGVSIKYVVENKRLGTAGAISLIEEDFEEPFIVLNADILTSLNLDLLLKHHKDSQADATVCVKEIEFQLPYGVVTTNGPRIIEMREKPVLKCLINAGIYVLSPPLINLVPKNIYCDMTQLIDSALRQGLKLSPYSINEYWMDIGYRKDYETANHDLSYKPQGFADNEMGSMNMTLQ